MLASKFLHCYSEGLERSGVDVEGKLKPIQKAGLAKGRECLKCCTHKFLFNLGLRKKRLPVPSNSQMK